MKTHLYTALALVAFAANSVLCRLALGEVAIDAGSFTVIRLVSGIVVLMMILGVKRDKAAVMAHGGWLPALMLFLYAGAFSFAYLSLDTGTGALILFGAVQMTMILVGVFTGKQLHYLEWLGVLFAFCGFVYLVLPGLSTPSLWGFALMSASGVAWGFYTLAGRGSKSPLADTASNFVRTLPLVIVLLAVTYEDAHLTKTGVLLAVCSGGIASGAGYAIWYAGLRGLSSIQAGVVQLLVPVIAAAGGVLFAHEPLSLRLTLASAMILGGIAVVMLGQKKKASETEKPQSVTG